MADFKDMSKQMAEQLSKKMEAKNVKDPSISEGALLEAINRLNKKADQSNSSSEELNLLVKKLVANGSTDWAKIIVLLGEKIDGLTTSITNRPDSFELDIKRNSDGFMTKVLIKPA